MTTLSGTRVALSFDDAPRMGTQGGVRASARCMDAVRETLVAHGIEKCVAFVIGVRAVGEEAVLERWLDAGYELGNHSWSHRRASTCRVDEFLADFLRCDTFLRGLPRFASAPRRFMRFPSLDSGADPAARERLALGVRDLGYTVLPGSLDVFDHVYESRMGGSDAEEVAQRWMRVATRALEFEARRMRPTAGEPPPHLHYGHFGVLSEHHLGRLLTRWQEAGVTFCDPAEAVVHPFYQRYLLLRQATGRVPCVLLRRGFAQRARHVLGRISARLGWFGQKRLGPLWPYLE